MNPPALPAAGRASPPARRICDAPPALAAFTASMRHAASEWRGAERARAARPGQLPGARWARQRKVSSAWRFGLEWHRRSVGAHVILVGGFSPAKGLSFLPDGQYRMTMQVEGACLCGTVRYAAQVDPERVFLCHCTDCQIHSGCMMSWSVPVSGATFVLLQGELKLFTKIAESGRKRELGFCGDCGTRILAKPHGTEPGTINLRVGALEQRDVLRPKVQVWMRSAQQWLDELGTVARLDTQP